MTNPGTRVRRQTRVARILHGSNALVLAILLLSGFALAGNLPVGWVDGLGGHTGVNTVHRLLGLAFAIVGAVLVMLLRRRLAALGREILRVHSRDFGWPLRYIRALCSPGDHAALEHDGRFDPLQRAVLGLLLLATLVTAASGVYLYFLPGAPAWVFALAIRAHIYAAWLLLAAVAIHILAGLGLLPTHRGVLRAMFGDGTVPLATAARLWPGWTRRQTRGTTGKPGRDPTASDPPSGLV